MDGHRGSGVKLQGDDALFGANGGFVGDVDGWQAVDELLEVAALGDDKLDRLVNYFWRA